MKRNTIGVDAINIRALLRDLSSKSSSPGVMVKLEEEEKSLSTQPDAANLLHISTCLIIRERMMLLLHLQPDEKDDGKALHQLYKDLNVEFNR